MRQLESGSITRFGLERNKSASDMVLQGARILGCRREAILHLLHSLVAGDDTGRVLIGPLLGPMKGVVFSFRHLAVRFLVGSEMAVECHFVIVQEVHCGWFSRRRCR